MGSASFSSQGWVSGGLLGTSSSEACRKSDSAFPTNWSERMVRIDRLLGYLKITSNSPIMLNPKNISQPYFAMGTSEFLVPGNYL